MDKITFDFKDRTALVTGGAQGFGLDIAKRFLNSGAKVIIWDVDPKMIEKVQKDLDNKNLTTNIVDVSNYKEVENCSKEITKIVPAIVIIGAKFLKSKKFFKSIASLNAIDENFTSLKKIIKKNNIIPI